MRSFLIRGLVLPIALTALSGCAFTQWTDHAFIGAPTDPPTHPNREWAGAVLLPVAAVGDIVTAPAQLVALLISGDDGIYAPFRSYSTNKTAAQCDSESSSERGSSWSSSPRRRWKTNKVRCDTSSLDRGSSWSSDADTQIGG